MSKSEQSLKRELVKYAHMIYQKGFVCATEGNVSVKLGEKCYVITPSKKSKGEIVERDLIIIDEKRQKLSGRGAPSIETPMHIAIYKARQDVCAIIHAHPPFTTAFSFSARRISPLKIPEIRYFFKRVETVPYLPFGSKKLASAVSKAVKKADVVILKKHGVVCVAKNLRDAFWNLERIEWAAKVLTILETLS